MFQNSESQPEHVTTGIKQIMCSLSYVQYLKWSFSLSLKSQIYDIL